MKLDLFDTVPFDFDTRKHHIVTVMVLVINRLTNVGIMSFEVDMLFCNERSYNHPDVYIYDFGSICYWTKNKALNYLTNPNIPYQDQTEVMKEFREKTQGVPYCFDAVVLSTQDYQK